MKSTQSDGGSDLCLESRSEKWGLEQDKQRRISLYPDSRGTTTLVTFDIVFPSGDPAGVLKNLTQVEICARLGFAFSAVAVKSPHGHSGKSQRCAQMFSWGWGRRRAPLLTPITWKLEICQIFYNLTSAQIQHYLQANALTIGYCYPISFGVFC